MFVCHVMGKDSLNKKFINPQTIKNGKKRKHAWKQAWQAGTE